VEDERVDSCGGALQMAWGSRVRAGRHLSQLGGYQTAGDRGGESLTAEKHRVIRFSRGEGAFVETWAKGAS
jgi:hypothetical protein